MAHENRPGESDEGVVNLEGNAVNSLVVVSDPMPPRGLTESESDELRQRASELALQLFEAEGAKAMELADMVSSVGMRAQREGGAELDLLRGRVGDLLAQDGTSNAIASSLIDLRVTLNEINPDELSRHGVVRNVASIMPFVSNMPDPLRVLKKIAVRYEPISRQITAIEAKLREGRTLLTRDNIELRQLYEQIEEQRGPIQRNAYLGELLMAELQRLIDESEDGRRADRIREALYDVSIRVQALRVIDEVFEQFFVSIEMTRQNNTRLGQAVEQTLTVATNVVTVGLAIQTALRRERDVMAALANTQEFIGGLIEANASSIRRHTEEIGEIYSRPLVAMEKITNAHRQLLDALDIADRQKQEGIDRARGNIAVLNRMSEELGQRSGAMRAPESAPSLEA
jgi:uncharacterized protein YaaN involved in tellurite resistance